MQPKPLRTTATAGAVAVTLAASPLRAQQPALERAWATEAVFETPESVAFDAERGVLYVSNIAGAPAEKDGRGFLSIVELDGTVRSLEWVGGLHAPKGAAVHGDRLYVADVDRLVEVALPGGEVVASHPLEGARFANGVDVGPDGTVWVTDTATGRIYRLRDGTAGMWLEDPRLERLNGILAEEGRLLVGTFAAGGLWAVDVATKELAPVTEGFEGFDGIVRAPDGGYLVSDWNGRVLWTDGEDPPVELLDTRPDEIGAADIEVVPPERLLLVPTFADGRVIAYRLEN